MTIQHLDWNGFLERVYDFESNPKEWKYQGVKPAIVEFYAEWCGACRSLAPTLEQVALKYDGQVVIYKVEVDDQQRLAAHFDVNSIPTLLFAPMDGKPQIVTGAIPQESMEKVIRETLLTN